MAQELLEMAKDLVMAMIRSNQVSPDEMQKELHKTYTSSAIPACPKDPIRPMSEGSPGASFGAQKSCSTRPA